MIVIRYVRLLVNITLVNYLLVVIIVITAGLVTITILPTIIIIFCMIVATISHLVSLSFVVDAPLGGSINLATFLVPLVTKFFHHLL